MTRYTCKECGWTGTEPARIKLHALPDLGEVALVVCPKCRYIESSLKEDKS